MQKTNEAMQAVPDTKCAPAVRTSTLLSCRLPALTGQRTCPPDPIPADLLFQGRQEIRIAHGDETYRLRLTRNDKLILTK